MSINRQYLSIMVFNLSTNVCGELFNLSLSCILISSLELLFGGKFCGQSHKIAS